MYIIERAPENLALARKRVVVHEWEDGHVEIHCDGRQLPYSVFENNPVVSQGAIVENKRLGAVLSVIQGAQTERDRARLAGKKLTKREMARIVKARATAGVTAAPAPSRPEGPLDAMIAYLNARNEEQATRRKVI